MMRLVMTCSHTVERKAELKCKIELSDLKETPPRFVSLSSEATTIRIGETGMLYVMSGDKILVKAKYGKWKVRETHEVSLPPRDGEYDGPYHQFAVGPFPEKNSYCDVWYEIAGPISYLGRNSENLFRKSVVPFAPLIAER